MAKQEQLPKIKPQEKPSLLNHGAGQGAFWGYIAGNLAAIPMILGTQKEVSKATQEILDTVGRGTVNDIVQEKILKSAKEIANKNAPKIIGVALAITAVGAVIGGFLGKSKQEKEQVEGREVKKPSSWNTGIITGLAVSAPIAIGIDYGKKALKASGKGGVGTILLGLASTATWVAGMVVGGGMRKKEMQRDYNQALNQLGEQKIAEGMAYKNAALSPQEQTILEGLMNAQKQGGHASKPAESREHATSVQMNL